MGIVVQTLTANQISDAQKLAQAVANSAKLVVQSGQFVFFAAFDGTNNDRNDVARSGNPLNTNVAQLFDQVSQKVAQGVNLAVQYYPGPGTAGALPNSAVAPTAQVMLAATNAYNDFAFQAARWLDTHQGGSVTAMVTSFSRGGASAAIFSQLLYEKGLVDPRTNKILIPPGQVGVSAGLIYDPVYTGIGGDSGFLAANLAFAPNAKNITVTRAINEYRYQFKAADYAGQAGITVANLAGNHCDNGGGYDNGLGALALQAGTNFFRASGLSIADAGTARQFDPSKPVTIHDEGVDAFGNQIWLEYGSVQLGTTRLTQAYATPASVQITANGTITTFTEQNGNVVTDQIINANGVFKEEIFKVSKLGGLYNEYHYNLQHNLVSEAWNWQDGAGREVRREQDSVTNTYHDYVHANADPNSKVIWEAWDWKDGAGRDVRHEQDDIYNAYHDYVHANGDRNSSVVWEAWDAKDNFGREVRHEQDDIALTYHDYVHADSDPNSAVIWETYDWKDGANREVVRQIDYLAQAYHDYVHATSDPKSTVVWEASGWKDSAGKLVRHEQDNVAHTYHDYVRANSDPNSAVIWESYDWKDGANREVVRQIDYLAQAYHDYVHATADANSKVVWEAWGWQDNAGHVVRHEQDNLTGLFHEYVHATNSGASPVISETYLTSGSMHFVQQKNDPSTGKKIATTEHQNAAANSPVISVSGFNVSGQIISTDTYIMSGSHTDRHDWNHRDTNLNLLNVGWETYKNNPWGGGDIHNFDITDYQATKNINFSTTHGIKHDWHSDNTNYGSIFAYIVGGRTHYTGGYWDNAGYHNVNDVLINPFG